MTSSVSGSSSTNFSRISGMSSGMDIDGMVKKLMDAERIPLDKFNANKQKLMWKQDAMRDINLTMKTFIDGTSAMRLQGTFGLFTTTSTDPTVVTAKGTATASDSMVQFSNITSLATSASTFTSTVGGLDGVTTTSINPNAVMNLVPFAAAPVPAAGNFTINALQKDGSYKTATISYNTSVDSLNMVLNRINAAGIGASAFYDAGSDKVVLSTNSTGQGTTGVSLQLTGATNFLTSTLGLSNADGTNAAFMLNGLATSRQSNTFTINGTDYTLLKTNAATVSVGTNRDVDGIVTKVKDFIDKYNTMIDKLNTKNSEQTYRDYQPLTDAQKSNMKDADITTWETKAKSGILNNDSTLNSAIKGLRDDMYSTVNGLPANTINQLVSLGITTGSYSTGGKLIIADETKLRNAIKNTPDQVTALFTKHDPLDSTKDGLGWKIYNRANSTISRFSSIAGSGMTTLDSSTISKSITAINIQISDFSTKLQSKENAYYAKFTAMEKALSRMNAQSASLTKMGG